jgi:coiled-coil domain-containing protein 130
MGVRYNAEKKKIGMYYSTPMFSFRCKCHLCSGWFEIQTDPQVRSHALFVHRWGRFCPNLVSCVQNTRYVVVSGARKKEEDWDPAENGGFAVIGLHIFSFYMYISGPGGLTPQLSVLQIQTVN